jgi:cytochrome c oxidase subunit 3
MLTLLLGLVFVTIQIYEFSHAGMRINDQAFGGVFFTLMGFHGLHVLAGVVFLIINLVRTRLGDFSPNRYEAVELGTWFWYYVTAVWVVLFGALYLL